MATLNFQGAAVATEPFGSLTIGPFSVAGSIAPAIFSLTLQSGNNSTAVPANAVGVIITPPSGNSVVLLYKTTSGDVGVNIPKGTASVFIFDTSNLPANVIINAASLTTGLTQLLFF